jgi:C1A family cysteine protease
VTVAIDASSDLMFYNGGVFDGECSGQINHAVTVTGYGTDGGKAYWNVKNSWGSGWGEGGYFRLKRGAGGDGQCHVSGYGQYPLL